MEKLQAYLNIKKIREPKWLDSERFIFSYNKSGVPQVWQGTTSKDSLKQLSDYTDFITTITTDPNNHRYAFNMAAGGNERSQIFYSAEGATPINLSNEPDAVHMLGEFIPNTDLLLFSSNLRNPDNFDLETIDVRTKERKIIVQNDDHYNFVDSVSPNGRYYIYQKLISESNQPLWCYDTKEKRTYPLFEEEAQYGSTVWLDHETFYYLTNVNSDFMYLAKYNMSKKKTTVCLQFYWDIESIGLSYDQKYLSVIVNVGGYLTLFVYKEKNMKPVDIPTPPKGALTFYDQAVWSPNDHRILFSHSSGTKVPNIWLIDVDALTLERLTDNELEDYTEELVEPILKNYTSFDGLVVPYWLYVPKGREPKDLPVLIEIHGGPEGQQMASFDELIAYIVSEGIAVVAPNVRGSTGYGKRYTHLDDVEKRLDSVKDIESLVKSLVEEEIANPEKIAVSGTSYGGFMTLSCAARYPDLFCAAVNTVGMFNLVTFLERTAGYRRAHRESEYGSLANDRELLYEVSPVAKVDNIKGPLMIIHGTNDPRVPVYEAQQVVEYLDDKNVEVKFLEYKDEGHGLNKLNNRLDCYPQVIEFLHEKMKIKKESL